MRRVLFIVLFVAGCTAHIPDGIYACDTEEDCPRGFECRESFCSRPDDEGAGAGSGSGAGAGAGSGSGGASGGGAGSPSTDGGRGSQRLVPLETGFRSLGGTRSGGGLRVYDERFEVSGRGCSADGSICLSGGFEP
jgi:hypothetical protein